MHNNIEIRILQHFSSRKVWTRNFSGELHETEKRSLNLSLANVCSVGLTAIIRHHSDERNS